MSVSVSMPQLGESVTEGTVTRWLKKEGERVEVDEPLLEVSTDKVDTEIPSPASGILRGIAVDEDETVAVGAQLAVIEDSESGDAAPPADDSASAEAAETSQPETSQPEASQPEASQPEAAEPQAAGAGAGPGGQRGRLEFAAQLCAARAILRAGLARVLGLVRAVSAGVRSPARVRSATRVRPARRLLLTPHRLRPTASPRHRLLTASPPSRLPRPRPTRRPRRTRPQDPLRPSRLRRVLRLPRVRRCRPTPSLRPRSTRRPRRCRPAPTRPMSPRWSASSPPSTP